MSNIPLDDRMKAAYFEAMKANGECASVTIHVGQAVWDQLKLRTEKVVGNLLRDDIVTLYGFPLVLEKFWAPHLIQVQIAKVIF